MSSGHVGFGSKRYKPEEAAIAVAKAAEIVKKKQARRKNSSDAATAAATGAPEDAMNNRRGTDMVNKVAPGVAARVSASTLPSPARGPRRSTQHAPHTGGTVTNSILHEAAKAKAEYASRDPGAQQRRDISAPMAGMGVASPFPSGPSLFTPPAAAAAATAASSSLSREDRDARDAVARAMRLKQEEDAAIQQQTQMAGMQSAKFGDHHSQTMFDNVFYRGPEPTIRPAVRFTQSTYIQARDIPSYLSSLSAAYKRHYTPTPVTSQSTLNHFFPHSSSLSSLSTFRETGGFRNVGNR
jgi:hypothetical protein